VAVILFDSGLQLDLAKLQGHTRRVVRRLIVIGVPITWALATVLAAVLLGMSKQSAIMLGAILVVSGPTVVGPLLNFVRPTERVQQILIWEGSLIDPVGAIVGALTFHAVVGSNSGRLGSGIGQFLASVAVGLAGGIVGTALLWLLLRRLQLAELLGTEAMLATVVAVAAACDVVRDDTGLIAAIVMGLGLANLHDFDIPARRPFFETVVQLIIGVLFISISATVTPDSLQGLVLPTLGLVGVLVLAARPLVALASTLWTDLSRGERGFIGWMAPRGIVAASTASTFSATLVAHGIGGADDILPVTFLVIVMTVTLYGLTSEPGARLLGVMRSARTRPLLVGGLPWVVDLGRALRSAGLDVLMWAGLQAQRDQITRAGLELAWGELLAAATSRGAELEGVTAALLLTGEDDFNALASTTLQSNLDGPVYRVAAPHDSHGVVAPYTGLARAGRTLGWCSPGRTVAPSTQSVSPGGSSSTPGWPACRRFDCMTSATATRLRRSQPASQPRSSPSGSGTPPSPSPWTPTAMSSPAWTPRPPAQSPGSSWATATKSRRVPLTRR
jgi:NhaP-type Na+/H+ or K+/H+ antiporter